MSEWRLTCELWIARAGWPLVAGVLLLCAGVLAHAWWLPREARELERLEARQRQAGAPGVSSSATAGRQADPAAALAQRYADFNAVLTPREHMTDLIATVFAEAGKAGIDLSQAEYRLTEERAGGFATYRMILPLKGPYPRLRQFIDGVLAAAPSAGLEEVSFKRDGIAVAGTEARVRFVFYLRGAAT